MTTDANKFEALNIFFDKIYILTINRGKERQEKLKKELAGLNFVFFNGFDKNDLEIDTLINQNIYNEKEAIKMQRYHRKMTLGEIACSLGHRAIYEDALKNRFHKILVLEDDVVANEDAISNFKQITDQLPNDWDVLYFDYLKNEKRTLKSFLKQQWYHLQSFFGFLNYSHKTIDNLFARNYSKFLKIAGYHDYASAYALSANAIKQLIALQTPVVFPADHLLPFAITNDLMKGFITVPKLFTQQSQSDKQGVGSFVEN
jgi:glycosyl transferase family 25